MFHTLLDTYLKQLWKTILGNFKDTFVRNYKDTTERAITGNLSLNLVESFDIIGGQMIG